MTDENKKTSDNRLRRRLLVIGVGSTAAALSGAMSAAYAQQTGMTDTDPSDPMNGGRGNRRTEDMIRNSDSDPQDPPGQSRRNGGAGRPLNEGRPRGNTDADPQDPPGQGRGRNPNNYPNRTGINDSDPQDPPGQGRGGNRPQHRGASDSDPQDPPGQGRGTRT